MQVTTPRVPALQSAAGTHRQILREHPGLRKSRFSDVDACGICQASRQSSMAAASRYLHQRRIAAAVELLFERASKMRTSFAGLLLLLTGMLSGCQCMPGSEGAYSAIDDLSDRLRSTPRLDNLYCEDLDPSRCTMHDRGQRMYVRGTHPRHRPR
jgi:hypothetical protein